jgi:hypothetical protein
LFDEPVVGAVMDIVFTINSKEGDTDLCIKALATARRRRSLGDDIGK